MSVIQSVLKKFVEVTNDSKPTTSSEGTAYGEIVINDNGTFVKLDGSDTITPVSTTSEVKDGDRVVVAIKNHAATVTGNLSDPSASSTNAKEIREHVTNLDVVIADKADIKDLTVQTGRIDTLEVDFVDVTSKLEAYNIEVKTLEAETVEISGKLEATSAEIDDLEASYLTVTGKLTAVDADIERLHTDKLDATTADIKYATIDSLEATNAVIEKLDATYATIENLEATNAAIEKLDTKYATIDSLEATNAIIDRLDTDKLSADDAEIHYAKIDFSNIGNAKIDEAFMKKFFADYGIIKEITISEGAVTKHLTAVVISGDLIEANTIKADKLMVKGEDGLYYKLNLDAGEIVTEQMTEEDLQNGLSGKVIIAKSITAEKVSVDDLVAFGATIGKFVITDDSIHSLLKDSVDNPVAGIYLGSDAQVAFGDDNRFFKFYKVKDEETGEDVRKLVIQADDIVFGAESKNLGDVADGFKSDHEELVSQLQILRDKIETFVTNGQNASVWTQTENGWEFSFGDLQEALNNTATKLENLSVEDVGTLSSELETLNSSINSLDDLKNAVKIVEIGGKPCIEISNKDSAFKIQITNTEFRIMEGSVKHVWIDNDAMNIRKLRVENEFEIGGFVWKRRNNGNVGIMWSTYSGASRLTIIVQSVGTSNQIDIDLLINDTVTYEFSGGHDDVTLSYTNVTSAAIMCSNDPDSGSVEMSTDGGATWTMIMSGYNSLGDVYNLPTSGTVYLRHPYTN